VFQVLVLLAQTRPVVLDLLAVDQVIERLTIRAGHERIDPALDTGHGLGRTADTHAPDLRLAVVRWVLLALTFAVAEEVNEMAVAVPLRHPIVGAIGGEPPRHALLINPQVALAVVGRFLPAPLGVRDRA